MSNIVVDPKKTPTSYRTNYFINFYSNPVASVCDSDIMVKRLSVRRKWLADEVQLADEVHRTNNKHSSAASVSLKWLLPLMTLLLVVTSLTRLPGEGNRALRLPQSYSRRENGTKNGTMPMTVLMPEAEAEPVLVPCLDWENLRDFGIVLMGDSITRYQYLSLVYFLRWGTWFDPRKMHPHLVQERSYETPLHGETWLEFYWQTNRMVAPYESCDCYRPMGKFNGRTMDQTCENRYYHDPERNITVTYLQAFGSVPQHGHLDPASALAHPILPPQQYTPYTWEYKGWHDTVRHHIAQLEPKPQYAVLNAGLWNNIFLSNDTARSDLREALISANIKGIWKTTTTDLNGGQPPHQSALDALMCDEMDGCLNLTWTKDLNPSLYWDKVHMYEPCYRKINEQMLQLILPTAMGMTAGEEMNHHRFEASPSINWATSGLSESQHTFLSLCPAEQATAQRRRGRQVTIA